MGLVIRVFDWGRMVWKSGLGDSGSEFKDVGLAFRWVSLRCSQRFEVKGAYAQRHNRFKVRVLKQ